MMLHNLLDYYKFNWRTSEYLKIRHCLIDQATTRLKSGSWLIDQAAAWSKSGGCLIDQAATKVKSGDCLIDQAAARLKSGSCLIDQDPGLWEVYICALINNFWCSVYNIKKLQKIMIWFNIFLTNTNMNIFRLTKKGEYKYKYIWFE